MFFTIFFNIQGSFFVEFLEHRGIITSNVYCETLQSLRKSIKSKRLELLTESVVLLHDNACPHASRVTHVKRAKFKWEQLDYPSYSLNMSPCDFHVFGPLINHLKSQSFKSDDELKEAEKD